MALTRRALGGDHRTGEHHGERSRVSDCEDREPVVLITSAATGSFWRGRRPMTFARKSQTPTIQRTQVPAAADTMTGLGFDRAGTMRHSGTTTFGRLQTVRSWKIIPVSGQWRAERTGPSRGECSQMYISGSLTPDLPSSNRPASRNETPSEVTITSYQFWLSATGQRARADPPAATLMLRD